MNTADIILIGILALVTGLTVWKMVLNKRQCKGKCSCGTGACAGCPMNKKDS